MFIIRTKASADKGKEAEESEPTLIVLEHFNTQVTDEATAQQALQAAKDEGAQEQMITPAPEHQTPDLVKQLFDVSKKTAVQAPGNWGRWYYGSPYRNSYFYGYGYGPYYGYYSSYPYYRWGNYGYYYGGYLYPYYGYNYTYSSYPYSYYYYYNPYYYYAHK